MKKIKVELTEEDKLELSKSRIGWKIIRAYDDFNNGRIVTDAISASDYVINYVLK
jgi:hypothetical protein